MSLTLLEFNLSFDETADVFWAEEACRGVMLEPQSTEVLPWLYKTRGGKLDKGKSLHLEELATFKTSAINFTTNLQIQTRTGELKEIKVED